MTSVMRSTYRELNPTEQRQVRTIKEIGEDLYAQFEQIGESRERALAKTKLEEAIMWATKAITT